MSATLAVDDASARPAKRMRKGTRSCLACRRRKMKCIFASDQDKICIQCDQHKIQCIPQGVVDLGDTSHDRWLKLKDRIDQLQSLVNRLVPSNREYAGSAGDDNDPLVKALENLLPSVQEAVAAKRSEQATLPRSSTATAPISGDHHDEAEEPLESQAAPLLRLIGDEVEADKARSTVHDAARRPGIAQAVAALMSAMPSEAEMEVIFVNRSSWWQLWRKNLELVWGSSATDTLRSFAALALAESDPGLLAILLVALATATGDRRRFLPPVELHVVHNDEIAGTEHGLSCLMILGLCYLNSLQPRRAWSVYRKANSLLQLNGIHLRHKGSPKRESIFWQLFHADRWVSLMIGLPYMVPDQLVDVSIGTVEELGASTYLYRHLAVLTGRVVDCLNEPKGPSLATALQVEQQLYDIQMHLPPGYLDTTQIRACGSQENKMTRLYRSVHLHQLRAYLHVSFFLRLSDSDRYEYSRRACVNDSRKLVEAYLEIFAIDPTAASDGSVLNCTAFTATVVVLIHAMGFDGRDEEKSVARPHASYDWQLIYRTLDALKYGQTGIAGALCRQCYDALDTLIKIARSHGVEGATVVLPYFGTVTCKAKTHRDQPKAAVGELSTPVQAINTPDSLAHAATVHGHTDAFANDRNGDVPFDGVQLDYSGPFTHEGPLTSWLPSEWPGLQTSANDMTWSGDFDTSQWDWINADLPPTLTF